MSYPISFARLVAIAVAILVAPQLQLSANAVEETDPARPETVQADISTRRVAVTSSFTGTEVIVFGSVDNSRQTNAAAGYYDVVIVIEGTKESLIARKKSHVGGIWINTDSQQFSNVPSYYAISSTRPLEDVASEEVLDKYRIGFSHVHMKPVVKPGDKKLSKAELDEFRKAVVRLKKASGLYIDKSYGTAFVGRSLFRSSIRLPANVSVGPFSARVYLFHDGVMLSQHTTQLQLEREGIELAMHQFAFGYPLLYGIVALLIAVSAGMGASYVFKKKT